MQASPVKKKRGFQGFKIDFTGKKQPLSTKKSTFGNVNALLHRSTLKTWTSVICQLGLRIKITKLLFQSTRKYQSKSVPTTTFFH